MTLLQIIVPAYIAVGVWFLLIEWSHSIKNVNKSGALDLLRMRWPEWGINLLMGLIGLIFFLIILATWPPVAIIRTYYKITTGEWTKDSKEV